MDNPTERETVNQVKRILQLFGLMKKNERDPGSPSQVQRINSGSFGGANGRVKSANKGTLDFEGYDNRGRFLGIECKRKDGGRVSPEQQERIDDINRKGGVAGVVHNGAEAVALLKNNGCI